MGNISVNTFTQGLYKDSATTVQTRNSYFDARNIRLNTDSTGQSIGGVINVEGNDLSFTFPDLCNVFTFDILGVSPYTVTLTIDAVNYNFTITSVDQEDQTQEIVNLINADAGLTAIGVVASVYDCNTVYITKNIPGTTLTLSSVSPEISNITPIIAPLTSFMVLGSANIRDDIYIMTTSTTGLPGGDGQIWKLQYDVITKVPTLTILYNSLLNFTTAHPIQMIGRYENDCTQRLYWTDNYNPLRTINVADDNTFAIPIDLIDLVPTVDHSAIQITDVLSGGNLLTGVYQILYRQKNVSGGETSFSIPSTLVNIVSADEDGPYQDYIGVNSGAISGKSIAFVVDGLDTNYEIVEFVAVYYETENGEPSFVSFAQEPVPATGRFEGIYSGNEGGTYNLTAAEIDALTSAFTHAKTIASKDNRLFAANVSNKKLEYDFDSRAYGHLQSSTTFNIDGAAETVFTNIAEDANAINDDYSLNKFKRSSTLYGGTGEYVEYEIKTQAIIADQKSLNTSSTSYESTPTRVVTNSNPDYTIGQYTHPGFNRQGMRFPNTYGLLRGYQRDEIYRFAIVFFDKKGDADFAQWIGDIKIPSSFDPLRAGYGTDGYTNGSFRGKIMEQVGVLNPVWYLNIPYIEFTVTLPSDIKDKIGGYSIVRVDRTDSDKTILGQGNAHLASKRFEINPTAPSTPTGGVRSGTAVLDNEDYIFLCNNTEQAPLSVPQTAVSYIRNTGGFNPADNAIVSESIQDEVITVDFPEDLFLSKINYRAGDQLKTVDVFSFDFNSSGSSTFDRDYKIDPSVYERSYQFLKYYKNAGTDGLVNYTQNITTDIDEFYKVPKAGNVTMDNGDIFLNETFNVYEQGDGYNVGFGEKTILMKTATPLYTNVDRAIAANLGVNTATSFDTTYIVNYYRPQPNQYGGNTYAQRGANTYIPTDHFTDIDCDSPSTTTSQVFGGDISMGVMHMQKIIKAWDGIYNEFTFGPLDPDGSPGYLSRKKSVTKFWPVESNVNVDLRQGRFIEKDDFNDNGTGNDLGEEFIYNSLYNKSGNARLFFPKPAQFQDCNEYYDTRIYASDLKINGENTDSWASWPVNQFIDTESLYGPINNITILNDGMIYHQDSAFGVVSINPRALITDQAGFGLELGSGSLLQDYTYISTSIGCKHQWSILTARKSLYWVDINTLKVYRMSGQGIENLSDIKGMHSYLRENLTGEVLLNYTDGGDNPLEDKGITGYYDPINNEAVYSFHGANRIQTYTIGVTYYPGDYVIDSAAPFNIFYITTEFTAAGSSTTELNANGNDLGDSRDYDNVFTLAFSEYSNSFTSFYDFTPRIYITNNDIILSPDKNSTKDLYLHNVGDFGKFYNTVYDTKLEFITNEFPSTTKTFDNLQWHHEILDYNSDVKDNTFETLKCSTSYQESPLITLDPITTKNIKRKERSWKVDVPRSTTNRERLRDKTMKTELTYNNTNNYRMVLHFVQSLFRKSFR